MTPGEVAGAWLRAYIDQKDLDAPEYASERRDLLAATPPECRFVGPDHRLAYISIINALIEKAQDEWK